jgi:hypothetical protein
MRALLRLYLTLTRSLGARRRFIGRLASTCLVLLGVHAAADLIDDLVYRLVDAIDLLVDSGVWWLLEGLASLGTLSTDTAASWGQDFASWLEVEEKDKVALTLALVVELAVDILLLDFAWGLRRAAPGDESEPVTLVDELKESVAELKAALWPLDIERIAVLPTMIAFCCGGAFLAGLAIESAASEILTELAPLWLWGVNVAAALGLLSVALLIWRFLPDLLHGAIMRSHERGEKFRRKTEYDPNESSTVEVWRRRFQRARRGTFMLLVLLPVAFVSLASQEAILGLIQRTGANL